MNSLTTPASSVICLSNGGKADNNPCNILSPLASKTVCAATQGGCMGSKEVADVSKGLSTVEIVLICIGLLLLLGVLFAVFSVTGGTAMAGGGMRKIWKRLF